MDITKVINWDNRVKKPIIYSVILAISLAVSYLIANISIVVGLVFLVIILVLPIIIKSLQSVTFGFYVLVCYSFILFFISRLMPKPLPVGIGVEALVVVLLAGILISGKKVNGDFFRNPITYVLLVSTGYGILQIFNPNAVSLGAWVLSTRALGLNLALFFVAVNVLDSKMAITRFTKLWLFLSLIAALYGIYQEIFGYQDFEWQRINSIPGLLPLIQNGAVLRKFSFFSDVATFGMFMAFSSVFSAILVLGPFKLKFRLLALAGAVLFLLGMSYSGTRTATAMVPIGLAMYGLLSINKKSTLLFGVAVLGMFLVFLYGPFYGSTALRLRSTFSPSDDASMTVRTRNRSRIQPYIYDHPMGGGVLTTGGAGSEHSATHILAGFPPDSGYLKTALEIGWIGLIIEMLLYFVVVAIGVINYYKIKSTSLKTLYAAYISSFFALCLANFTQEAMTQKPTIIIVFALFAIMPNMIKFDST